MELDTNIQKQIEIFAKEIKQFVEIQKTKIVHSVNTGMLFTNWQIGRMIVEKQNILGVDFHSDRQFILFLSKELSKLLGKGYSRSNLFNMRMFYTVYPDVQTVSGQLSWSHYCELICISDVDKRNFYQIESENNSWSIKQ